MIKTFLLINLPRQRKYHNISLIIRRYDSEIRYESDMINYSRPLLTCDISKLNQFSRPYFSYDLDEAKSMQGLQLRYDMPEWVFFLCAVLTPILIVRIKKNYLSQMFSPYY